MSQQDLRNVHKNSCKHISKPGIKCGDGVCPHGTHCCQESNANHVTCCAKKSCNPKTGHCSEPRQSECPTKETYEGYTHGSENSNPCGQWKLAMGLMMFIVLVLGFGFITVGIQCQKLMSSQNN